MLDSEIHYNAYCKIQKADVWGDFDHDTGKSLGDGMIVARADDICPVWGDKIPYKSVTVICNVEDCGDVAYWLEYVHGYGCMSMDKTLPDGRIAVRSDYQCW